jgi:hypothetical protein
MRTHEGISQSDPCPGRKYGSAVVGHKEKDQATGLELAESFVLCGYQAYKTHIKSIVMFCLFMMTIKSS